MLSTTVVLLGSNAVNRSGIARLCWVVMLSTIVVLLDSNAVDRRWYCQVVMLSTVVVLLHKAIDRNGIAR